MTCRHSYQRRRHHRSRHPTSPDSRDRRPKSPQMVRGRTDARMALELPYARSNTRPADPTWVNGRMLLIWCCCDSLPETSDVRRIRPLQRMQAARQSEGHAIVRHPQAAAEQHRWPRATRKQEEGQKGCRWDPRCSAHDVGCRQSRACPLYSSAKRRPVTPSLRPERELALAGDIRNRR